jgi:hypothetical protein
MAGTKRPSFLKSQKEQKRKAKAQEKREARQNKRARAAEAAAAGEAGPDFAAPQPGAEAGSGTGVTESPRESKS